MLRDAQSGLELSENVMRAWSSHHRRFAVVWTQCAEFHALWQCADARPFDEVPDMLPMIVGCFDRSLKGNGFVFIGSYSSRGPRASRTHPNTLLRNPLATRLVHGRFGCDRTGKRKLSVESVGVYRALRFCARCPIFCRTLQNSPSILHTVKEKGFLRARLVAGSKQE